MQKIVSNLSLIGNHKSQLSDPNQKSTHPENTRWCRVRPCRLPPRKIKSDLCIRNQLYLEAEQLAFGAISAAFIPVSIFISAVELIHRTPLYNPSHSQLDG